MSYLGNYPEIQQFTIVVDKFNGDGACTVFALSRPIDDPVAVEVWVNSVPQTPIDSYSLSSTGVITFTEAPSVGSNNIVIFNRATTVYTRTQVGTSDIQDGAVTTAKLSTTGVSSGTYGGASNVSVITVDTKGRITSASNVAISIPTQFETVNAIPTMLMLSGM